MPQHKSCKKRMKTSKAENTRNRAGKSTIKGAIRKALSAKTKADALPLVREATSTLDRMVSKGILHRNKAANQKSRLDSFLNKLA